MNKVLCIQLKDHNTELPKFPCDGEDQFLVWSGYQDHGQKRYVAEFELGDADDTTSAQEQYLNTHDEVYKYWIEDRSDIRT